MKRSDISDKEVCEAVAYYQKMIHARLDTDFPYEMLAKKFGCSEKVAFSACERADEHGLIEYGVSLRTGWLTDKGKALLDSMASQKIDK